MTDNKRFSSIFFTKYPAGKACPTCKKLYPISEFAIRHKINSKGYAVTVRRWKCNDCRRKEKFYIPTAEWNAILDAFSHSCAYCGSTGVLEPDHVIPQSKGGLDSVGNIVPACRSCNSRKQAKDMRDYVNDECLYEAIMMGMGDAEYSASSHSD